MTTATIKLPPKLVPLFAPPRGDLRFRVAYAALVAEAKSVEAVSKAWPDDDRIDAIGQNGATGEHYNGKPNWNDAPKWAGWKAQNSNGAWNYFEDMPAMGRGCWVVRSGLATTNFEPGEYNADWRLTLEAVNPVAASA